MATKCFPFCPLLGIFLVLVFFAGMKARFYTGRLCFHSSSTPSGRPASRFLSWQAGNGLWGSSAGSPAGIKYAAPSKNMLPNWLAQSQSVIVFLAGRDLANFAPGGDLACAPPKEARFMHVGYGTGFQHLGSYSDRQFMREELGNCEMAEPWGFDSVWATEHHFDNYSLSPDVCQLLSYIAGQTKRIKLGSMVVVVPWHDPVRLAEQISLLDHVSGGRYILGVGRGLARREFEGLRIDQNEGRMRFDEYTQLVLDALETGFMEGGATVKQPRREIRPRPFKSFAGRRFAAAASKDSVPSVAKLGLGLLIILQKPWDQVKADLDTYHQRWGEFHPRLAPPKPFCSGFCFVDESADRAAELAR